MALSPTKLRNATMTTIPESEDSRHFRSIFVSDIIDEDNDIEVINSTEVENSKMPRRTQEEKEPMTKEKRLVVKQLERWHVAMTKKSKRLGRKSVGWNAKTQGDDEKNDFDNLFGTNSTFGQELRVVSYPWPIWVFGVVIMLGASIFVLSVYKTRNVDANEMPRDTTWWKYLVAVVIYVLGFALIVNGKIETFYMNKHSSQLIVRSSKPLCLYARYNRSIERNMSHITNIRVECAGDYSGDVDTRTYKVHFDFDDGTHVSALESRSKPKTMRRCRHIKNFVAQSSSPIALQRSASECLSPIDSSVHHSPLRHIVTSPATFSLE
ncbi:uncharacterized protein PHALS_13062 [Plasmopara halstedii]|uniref:Transmembrane protein, putative n=1 Tax=Plasmopara halstedii TaxID=4781 RepID=A0A0P1AP79_PLAHL|nr:uncharacterized protein PHALS_13062 [Plasmopara halstedii]CEG42818.1 transmembrane protein, putative [Plasmopara halstedii]|eukprot:XP_024579187.1 transmembrane protein, putative [Plasmopara halstedii]